jgi:HEXXH motif-containing protein
MISSLPDASSPSCAGWFRDLIGEPPKAVASELKSRDFLFLTPGATKDRAEIVAAAERLIDHVPSVSSAVRGIVDAVFLLAAREEYDVSHSEPRWPGWIFVSAPCSVGAVSGLRLAENVVHETMHLQLTLLEARTPLVADAASTLHSPWKNEPRDLQGILHGLYVFACISAFLHKLLEPGALPDDGAAHARRRIALIREEVAAVPMRRLAHGLTQAGRRFLEQVRMETVSEQLSPRPGSG